MKRLFLAAWLALTAACGITEPTGPDGTYRLTTLNGQQLPVVLAEAGLDRIEMVQETVVLQEGGQFRRHYTLRSHISGLDATQDVHETGHWAASGGTVVFYFDNGASLVGLFQGRQMLLSFGGYHLVYLRR